MKKNEIGYLEKELKKSETKGYFVGLVVMLTIIYIVDELASNMNSTMQPYMIYDLFKIPGASALTDEYSAAVGTMTLLTLPNYLIMLLSPFYKSLADKFGRKMFLIINTAVMGLGLAICMIAPNYIVYAIGILVVLFVQTNDVQVMYIMESAPAKHRAKVASATKAIALVGVSLIGVAKTVFYDPSDLSSWRKVFIIPAVFGIAVALICIPLVKETPVFLTKKLKALKGEKEDEDTNEKKEDNNKGGVVNALKYIFSNKQMRSITIAGIIFCLATGVTGYYATILEVAGGNGAITPDQINRIVIFFPFINGLVTFISGFLSDALGRKKACILLSVFAVAGLATFIFGAGLGFNEYVIGTAYGLFIGGLWSICDTLVLVMPSESTPTELRASVIGTMALIMGVGMALSSILIAVGMNVVGSANIGMLCFAMTVPFMLIAIFLITKNVKETNGADLTNIEM
ncbi:MAG: MFS transporter [Lachnospiraceae bacterium]|nr:MFS transporter [Lachnospiraceae bacterium]